MIEDKGPCFGQASHVKKIEQQKVGGSPTKSAWRKMLGNAHARKKRNKT
ncbi:hypothetical protein NEISUBOT_03952 [Neisseria subflava NJ9703]|uniref:Uncharacterized protein n=1 Tax=Neisseria subflava NJ9703 TaxID=546268 RepID=A0A9W5MZN2_NEISU|nr:hypothetical protein NEISUBOT_03952 [Neisseria subflava NJ9703]